MDDSLNAGKLSAAIAGLASGPFLWTVLSQEIGRSSCIFWGLLGTLGCGMWAARMTDQTDYIPFVISRWLGGTFGSAASTIGAGTVLDMFFLHQRGKAFTCYTLSTLFGTQVGPTFSGFIAEYAPWPIQYWWTIGVEGLAALLVFLFLEETGFSRDGKVYPMLPRSWPRNRLATFLPGSKTVPQTRTHGLQSLLTVFLVFICPITLLAGTFLLIAFGWAVAVTTLLSVFLQTPVLKGGYGFSPLQVSCFTFAQWIAILAAEVYGMLVNDRIPLWFCHRFRSGVWTPETRLYPLLFMPAILLPIGLGLFGSALQYHLHYMVLALGVFPITFCEIALAPIIVTYVVECFTDLAAEVNTVLNFFRLILGLAVPFFINPWLERAGAGWVFGMMAFFTLFAFSLTGLLAWKGEVVRRCSVARLGRSEEGTQLIVEGGVC